jgi:hypothetical protein
MSAKTSVLTATLLALMTAHATAQDCSGPTVAIDTAALTSFLKNKLICAYKPDSGGTDPNQRWSETHVSGGQLEEFGPGNSSTIQKPEVIGSWLTEMGSHSLPVVKYDYGSDQIYTHQVRYHPDADDPTAVVFCTDAASPTPVAIIDGAGLNGGSLLSRPASAADPNPCW